MNSQYIKLNNLHELKNQKLLIADIRGVHPEIERILVESGANEYLKNYIPVIPYEEIKSFSERSPILLHRYKSKYFVISNLELYRSVLLNPTQDILVFVGILEFKMCKFIRAIIRDELLIRPSLNAKSYNPKYLYLINKWMNHSKNYNGIKDVPTTKSGFSKWMHIDERKIK